MQDLSYLSLLDTEAFEAERSRLIINEILKAPVHRQKALFSMQAELDRLRGEVSAVQFISICLSRAGENLENVTDLLACIRHLEEGPPAIAGDTRASPGTSE